VRQGTISCETPASLQGPRPFLLPLFTEVRGIGFLGSPYAKSCITPVLCGQKPHHSGASLSPGPNTS
jgi:hypothetical protein